MEDTRQRILDTAAELFARQGYHAVTMRAIAGALGISVGNLTYHFPRKQDIASALLEQELGTILQPPASSLAALDGYLRRMLVSLLDHARLFSDPLLFADLPQQQEENRARIGRLRLRLREFLETLRGAGLFTPALDGQALDDLVDILMFSHVGWQQDTLVSRRAPQAAVDDMMRAQWRLLAPSLTAEGRRQLAALAREKGVPAAPEI